MQKHKQKVGERQLSYLLLRTKPDTAPLPGAKGRIWSRVAAATAGANDGRMLTHLPRLLAVRLPLAAAAILMVVVAGWWFIGANVEKASAASLFDMVKRLGLVSSVSYDFVSRSSDGHELKARIYLSKSGRYIITHPDGEIQICDDAQRKALVLKPALMTARSIDLFDSCGARQTFERLKKLNASSGRLTGQELLQGRKTSVFELDLESQKVLIWVDEESQLPLRVESRQGTGAAELLLNFAWQESHTENEFSLSLPPGYQWEKEDQGNIAASILEMLRFCADTSENGCFPTDLTSRTVNNAMVNRWGVRSPPSESSITNTFVGSEDSEIVRQCKSYSRAMSFISRLSESGDWKYVGQGVRLGEADKVVCYWRIHGSSVLSVVYGDLKIREVSQSELDILLQK